jgi:GntR family transcriptional regulator
VSEIQIQLDFRAGLPIYMQIVQQVSNLVAGGSLKPGDQLPTVRQLAAELRVNFNTVARAYRMLDESRLISTQQGRGTYILEAPPPELQQHLRLEALDGMTRRYIIETRRQGYTDNEVKACFLEQLSNGQDEATDEVV